MKKIIYLYTLALTILCLILLPFIYMVSVSFMSYDEIISHKLLPSSMNFSNYQAIFYETSIIKYFFNTIITGTLSTIGTLVTTTLAAFGFLMLEFRGKKYILFTLVAILMVPYEVVAYNNFLTISQMGLLDTYIGLILPSTANIFYIFFLINYLQSAPVTYYQRAKISGATDLEFIIMILVPHAKPALYIIAALSFIEGCNSYLWPMLISDSDMHLLSSGLSTFDTQGGQAIPLQMAIATVSTLPIMIFYFIVRKQFITER